MSLIIKNINKLLLKIFYIFIIFYQNIVSPLIPARCRYYPTCSNYGRQALAWHGIWSGSWLLLKRLGRCQPWGGHGVDFVPLPLSTYRYDYLKCSKLSSIKQSSLNGLRNNSVYRDNYDYIARLNDLMRF